LQAHSEERWSDRGTLWSLWAGLGLGPLAWAVNLQVNYAVSALGCTTGWLVVMHLVTVAALAAAGTGAWISWKNWQAAGDGPEHDGTRRGRSRFLAWSGLLFSGYFGLAILAQWIPTFVIEPCRF
jgi:hypothetical protein